MTTYQTQVQVCCLCGTKNECSVLGSTNTMGSPDLDLRPAPMERDTMHSWFQECDSCHYVSVDLSRESENAKQIVASDEYSDLLSNLDLPQIARRFALCALLNAHDREIAGTALLRAAWVCDDESNPELATGYRNQAADILLKLQPFEDGEDQATIATMLVDVLRRAGRFEQATKLANQMLKFKTVKRSDVMAAVIKFQMSLINSKSSECRKVEEAIGN